MTLKLLAFKENCKWLSKFNNNADSFLFLIKDYKNVWQSSKKKRGGKIYLVSSLSIKRNQRKRNPKYSFWKSRREGMLITCKGSTVTGFSKKFLFKMKIWAWKIGGAKVKGKRLEVYFKINKYQAFCVLEML